jgi:hypothetical protein
MSNLDDVWKGDKLNRKSEARMLERFLANETDALKRLGRPQAFVLALDAQYGEGKTWFLTRLRQQLSLNHPVAFIDAWVDDANNEPLVSIMSAIDDALQPFLKSKKIKDRLVDLTHAALPILGKAAVGAGGKFIGKWLGDGFGGEARDALAESGKKDDDDTPSDIAFDKLTEGVSEVVDNAGKALLSQYRSRQKSREAFKENLRLLAASVEKTDVDPRHNPIFVIVDELDRCRPDYAVSLLESIKHLFDVPGIVFIIALHGNQLTASIEAIYGSKFDATSYLRRFFTRHYELRRLSIRELVVSLFGDIPPNDIKFSYPDVWLNGKIIQPSPQDLAGNLLSEWRVTPREAQSIMDGLRLFMANWDHKGVPIELTLVLILLVNLVRGLPLDINVSTVAGREVDFAGNIDIYANGSRAKHASTDLFAIYERGSNNSLHQIAKNNEESGLYGYMTAVLGHEYQVRFQSSHNVNSEPHLPSWSEYRDRIRELGRFVEQQPDETN